MIVHVTQLELLAGIGLLVIVVWGWRASVRRAKRVATAARVGAKRASLAGRVLIAAALLGGVQWVLVTHPGNPGLLAATLAIPDLLAGYVVARALTTTEDRGRGGRR